MKDKKETENRLREIEIGHIVRHSLETIYMLTRHNDYRDEVIKNIYRELGEKIKMDNLLEDIF